MSNKTITTAVVREFLAGNIDDLSEFTSIDDTAAELLAVPWNEDETDLWLQGVKSLTAVSARALAKWSRDWLGLSGLTFLPEDVATALSKLNCRSLDLSGLREITGGAAKALSANKPTKYLETGEWGGHWHHLRLSGLEQLSPESARAIAAYSGILTLGIPELSKDAAAALAGHDGELRLDCLTTLTQKTAAALAQHRGPICLRGLTILEEGVAALLAASHRDGRIELPHLETLSDSSAEAIADSKTKFYFSIRLKVSPKSALRLALCENRSLYEEIRSIRVAMKKASGANSRREPTAPGCPVEVLEWMNGGVIALECTTGAYQKALKSGILAKQNIDSPALRNDIDSGKWVIAECGLVDYAAQALSKQLKSLAVHLFYDDTSGLVGYEIYNHGVTVERMSITDDELSEYCEASGDSDSYAVVDGQKAHLSFVKDSERISFDSMLVDAKKGAVAKKMGFINKRFADLGICIPAKG